MKKHALRCVALHSIIVFDCIVRPYTRDRYRVGIPRELSKFRTQPWLSVQGTYRTLV